MSQPLLRALARRPVHEPTATTASSAGRCLAWGEISTPFVALGTVPSRPRRRCRLRFRSQLAAPPAARRLGLIWGLAAQRGAAQGLVLLAGGLLPAGLAANAAPSAPSTASTPSAVASQPVPPGAAALLGQEPLVLGASLAPDPSLAPPPTARPTAVAPPQAGAPLQPAASLQPSEADQPLRPKLASPSGSPLGAAAPVGGPLATAPLAPQRQLVLDRQRRLLRVLENGQELKRFPVAVGMPGWETPVGSFSVIEKISNPIWEHPAKGIRFKPGPDNPLGSRWIGFYRDCKGRSGFNGQEQLEVRGCVTAGFHGTPNRESVGQAVSHGCVRLFDEHVQELYDLVTLGTTVTVLP